MSLISLNSNVYSSCRVKIASLKVDKAPTAILSKYTNFLNIFYRFNNKTSRVYQDQLLYHQVER